MHTLYFTALFAVLHLLAFPVNTAAALGINCLGHGGCASAEVTVAQSLVTTIMGIDPSQWYNNGEHIACETERFTHENITICAFLQHMPSGATGMDIQRLAHYITDHGCTICGSVPFHYPSDNDVSKGELTFNFVNQPPSTTAAQATTATATTAAGTPTSSSPPANIPSDISLSGGIEHCPGGSPGDALSCTFTAQNTSATYRLSSIVGSPVENCQGSNQTVQTVIGGSATITQGWSDSQTLNFIPGILDPILDFLTIGGSGSWNQQQSWQAQQTVTITVGPGQQAALVIEVLNNVITGQMLLHYSNPVNGSNYWYINNVTLYQPTNDTIYNTPVISCDASFNLPRAPPLVPIPPHSSALSIHPDLSVVFSHILVTLFLVSRSPWN